MSLLDRDRQRERERERERERPTHHTHTHTHTHTHVNIHAHINHFPVRVVAGLLITLNLGVLVVYLYYEILDYRKEFHAAKKESSSGVELKPTGAEGNGEGENTDGSRSKQLEEKSDQRKVMDDERDNSQSLVEQSGSTTFSPMFVDNYQ